jgi:hypothetical protein
MSNGLCDGPTARSARYAVPSKAAVGLPIQDERDRERGPLFGGGDQKLLTVRRHDVLLARDRPNGRDVRREEWHGRPDASRASVRVNDNRHQALVRRHVEHLSAVPPASGPGCRLL